VALTIASREVDGVTVLDLSGRITLGEGSVQLRDAIRDLISKGSKKHPAEPGRRELHR
jgi:anti-sigma B factor antagonist